MASGACAVMLVKDEADIIAVTVRHLLAQLDFVIVSDNLSTDGTPEIVGKLADETGRVLLTVDEEVGYFQSEKTTRLARIAYETGFKWVVPCDADEIWYSPFGRLADVLDAAPLGTLFAPAPIINHVATGKDPKTEPDPTKRLGWHIREHGRLPKVACRTSADLTIGMGNHDAVTSGLIDSATGGRADGQLYIHHFPWRSEEQFERKIRNGSIAYANAPALVENGNSFGEHWRQFGTPDDPYFSNRVRGWFRQWGYRHLPDRDPELIYDPAPVSR